MTSPEKADAESRGASAAPAPPPRAARLGVVALGLAIAYVVTGWLGLLVASKPGNVTALWPPSGIALATLLVFGRRAWPGVLVGSFLTNVVFFPASEPGAGSLLGPGIIAAGSTLEILGAAWLVERYAGRATALSSPAGVLRFAVCCAASSLLGALGGLLATAGLGDLPLAQAPSFIATWWIGDTVGMLAIAPLVLTREPARSRARALEWVALALSALVLVQLVFGRPFAWPPGTTLPLPWLVLPLTIWAGTRLGARAVALQTLLLHALISWATVDGRGPMPAMGQGMALVVLDGLLVTTLLAGLLLSAMREQTARSLEALEESRRSLEARVVERTQTLERTNDALKEEIAERTRLGRQLMESQKREALGRLAGGVAHDFNNLLTVIAGEAGLLANDPKASPETLDSSRSILAAGQRAAELTRQLLAVARRQPGAPKTVAIGRALSETRRLLRPVLPEHVELALGEIDPALCVRMDPTQLDQIVLNLALNARDAMPDGGKLSITCDAASLDAAGAREADLTEGDWVRLRVSDDGQGIAPEILPRIFEPFFTTKPGERGTGLGLSTAAGIVEQAGGALRVESTVGVGTTFTVWLPRAVADAESAPPPPPATSSTTSKATILVVEDEPLVRRLVRTALERRGYSVVVASDGEEALGVARAREGHLDLVLTDVVMPRMGGPELVRTLRKRGEVNAMFMSGYHEHQEELAGERFLPKPFSVEQLLSAVDEALVRN